MFLTLISRYSDIYYTRFVTFNSEDALVQRGKRSSAASPDALEEFRIGLIFSYDSRLHSRPGQIARIRLFRAAESRAIALHHD